MSRSCIAKACFWWESEGQQFLFIARFVVLLNVSVQLCVVKVVSRFACECMCVCALIHEVHSHLFSPLAAVLILAG